MSAGCLICGSSLSASCLLPCLNASIHSISCDIVVDARSVYIKIYDANTIRGNKVFSSCL